MRTVRLALFLSLVCSASAAWAQYGLYGAPQTLLVSQQELVQPYATPDYNPARPQYCYPAQTPVAVMYQPYQAGPQYRYPSPYATRRRCGRPPPSSPE